MVRNTVPRFNCCTGPTADIMPSSASSASSSISLYVGMPRCMNTGFSEKRVGLRCMSIVKKQHITAMTSGADRLLENCWVDGP